MIDPKFEFSLLTPIEVAQKLEDFALKHKAVDAQLKALNLQARMLNTHAQTLRQMCQHVRPDGSVAFDSHIAGKNLRCLYCKKGFRCPCPEKAVKAEPPLTYQDPDNSRGILEVSWATCTICGTREQRATRRHYA